MTGPNYEFVLVVVTVVCNNQSLNLGSTNLLNQVFALNMSGFLGLLGYIASSPGMN